MEQRHPDDRNCEGSHKRRQQDLVGGVNDRLLQWTACGQVGVDVFNHDRGVIDQNSDGQRQPAQGHDVDRLLLNMQEDERAQDGEWERSEHDYRRAPGPQ